MKTLVNNLVQEAIQRDLVSKSDLARSHIQFDHTTKSYVNKKLNVHVVQTRKGKQFDAKKIIETYNSKNIFGAPLAISQIHLSSKSQYET